MLKKVVPFCVLIVSLFCTNIIGNFATHRSYMYEEPPLYDVVHSWFSPISPVILDVILLVSNIVTILLLLYKSVKQKTIIYFNKICLTIGILYLIRCICIYVTYLPNSTECETSDTDNFITTVRKDFCGDLMFSGHTFQFAMSCIIIHMFYPNKWVKITGVISSLIYGLFISISRLHYTIDVIIAMYSTLFVYQNVEMYYPRLFD